MPDDNAAIKTASAKAKSAPAGKIFYNPNLGSWQCRSAAGRLVLNTGSLEAAKSAYPGYTVKEQ